MGLGLVTGPWARHIQTLELMLLNKGLNPACCLTHSQLQGIDQQIRAFLLNTFQKRLFRSPREGPEINNDGSFRLLQVVNRTFEITLAWQCFQGITIRNNAVLRQSPIRTVTTTGPLGIKGGIEGATIDPRLPA